MDKFRSILQNEIRDHGVSLHACTLNLNVRQNKL